MRSRLPYSAPGGPDIVARFTTTVTTVSCPGVSTSVKGEPAVKSV